MVSHTNLTEERGFGGKENIMSIQDQIKILRVKYGFTFVVLTIVEVCIALFIQDRFIRPYIGDVLVVLVVYCFIRMFLPVKCRLLPLYVFLFAVGVEVLQYFEIVRVLGLQDHIFFRTLLGSVFDVKDILCYGAGCVLLTGYELWRKKKGDDSR